MAAVTEVPADQDLDDLRFYGVLIYRVLGDRETLYSSPR